jgi:GNAT superfamily N-acetyltransferase
MSDVGADGTFRVSTASMSEVDLAVRWAQREGWNPGLSDARSFREADPDGFLLGTLDQRPVATVSAVRYDGYAFVGLYIVDPDVRGRGFGMRIWTAAMDRTAGLVTGLDGVVAQQDNYRRSGFALAHRNVRYAGVVAGRTHPGVIPLSKADLDEVAVYDHPCFGAPRRRFLAQWLDQPGAQALGMRSGTQLTGYGVVRPAHDGFKVGPLFADDAGPGSTLVLDVPEPNDAAVALARDAGMVPVFETARMYRGGEPTLALDRVFGITSFELG